MGKRKVKKEKVKVKVTEQRRARKTRHIKEIVEMR